MEVWILLYCMPWNPVLCRFESVVIPVPTSSDRPWRALGRDGLITVVEFKTTGILAHAAERCPANRVGFSDAGSILIEWGMCRRRDVAKL